MSSVADGEMLRVDEGVVRGHVDEVVRSSVEETLNGRMDAESCTAMAHPESTRNRLKSSL